MHSIPLANEKPRTRFPIFSGSHHRFLHHAVVLLTRQTFAVWRMNDLRARGACYRLPASRFELFD